MIWEPIHSWLTRAVPGRPVIRRNGDGKLPPRPFITARVIAEVREGQASVGPMSDDGDVFIQQGALITVSVQTWGDDAFDMASAIRSSLERPSQQDHFNGDGLAYVRVLSGPTDVPAIVGSGWEDRAVLDVQLRTRIAFIDRLGIIERVELTGDLGSEVYTETIDPYP